MIIVVGNDIGDSSSNPGWGNLHFTRHLYTRKKGESNYSSNNAQIVRMTEVFNLGMATCLGEGKLWIKSPLNPA